MADSAELIYAVPAGKVVNKVNWWWTSVSASPRQVTAHFVPAGGSLDDSNKVVDLKNDSLKIPVGHERPFEFRQVLRPGDEIHWFADVADEVAGTLSVQEIDESDTEADRGKIVIPKITGVSPVTVDLQTRTYARSDIGYIAASPSYTTAYTVPAGKQVIGMTLLIHNTDTVGRPEGVFALPSGGSDDVRYLIGTHHGTIPAGVTRERYYPLFLTAGATVKLNTTVADKLVYALSVEEIEV